MKDLRCLQDLFNEKFNFEHLKAESIEYIRGILNDCDNNFLAEEFDDYHKRHELKNLMIKYSSTNIIINREGFFPCFRIKFYLEEPYNGRDVFTYEIEYNTVGEFTDEYFIEIK